MRKQKEFYQISRSGEERTARTFEIFYHFVKLLSCTLKLFGKALFAVTLTAIRAEIFQSKSHFIANERTCTLGTKLTTHNQFANSAI